MQSSVVTNSATAFATIESVTNHLKIYRAPDALMALTSQHKASAIRTQQNDPYMARKLFVTTALPYANAPFHIGDIFSPCQQKRYPVAVFHPGVAGLLDGLVFSVDMS